MNTKRAMVAAFVGLCSAMIAYSQSTRPSDEANGSKDRSAFPVDIVAKSHDRTTHLNVDIGAIVNLESFCVESRPFVGNTSELYYDRVSEPIEIPAGYSFVVTDLIFWPFCDGVPPSSDTQFVLLVEDEQVERKFTAVFRGDSMQHYALAGGLVFPSGVTPRFRNAPVGDTPTTSHGHAQVQVIGYFIKGSGLLPGRPFGG